MASSAKEIVHQLIREQLEAYARNRGRRHDKTYCPDLEHLGQIGERDARRFLRSIDLGMVRPREDGEFELVACQEKLRLFACGTPRAKPQKIFAAPGPITKIGLMAWLHDEMGWPLDLMVPGRPRAPFDLSCRKPGSVTWQIHCEVETSARDADRLVGFIAASLEEAPSRAKHPWLKRAAAFWSAPASVFCAVAPGGYTRIMRMTPGGGTRGMEEGTARDLRYGLA
jgi:hypothetical protein